MTEQDFNFVRGIVERHSAVALDGGKRYLVETRLAPLVRELKLSSISELVRQLREEPGNGIQARVVEAMVTTETSFFRDGQPFEALRTAVLPDLVRRRSTERRLNVWCAACSTGQEPYSVALILREHFPEVASWQVRLLATDLSRDVLARAREGRFNQIEISRGLPAALLARHFRRQGPAWQIGDEIRRMVEFREMNLAQPWPPLPRFDLILLRNVMIYFDVETKKQVLARAARALEPDGYLLLGGAETPFNLDGSYRRVESLRTGFYQLDS